MKKEKKVEAAPVEPVEEQVAAAEPEQTGRFGRFVDVSVQERQVGVRLSDERLLQIADEACNKHREIAIHKAEIKAFADARKDLIKGLTEQAKELDEQFYRKTEQVEKEVRVIRDYSAGRLRVEDIETDDVYEDRELLPTEFQREFADLLDMDPSEQFMQRTADMIRMLLDGGVETYDFAPHVAESLGCSLAFAQRVIERLKWQEVLQGEGTEADPFTVGDPARDCEFCRHGVNSDGPGCDECWGANDMQHLERAYKCESCRYARQYKCFKPCRDCSPNGLASGFEPMPQD